MYRIRYSNETEFLSRMHRLIALQMREIICITYSDIEIIGLI